MEKYTKNHSISHRTDAIHKTNVQRAKTENDTFAKKIKK